LLEFQGIFPVVGQFDLNPIDLVLAASGAPRHKYAWRH
jgi:hypothetical protein